VLAPGNLWHAVHCDEQIDMLAAHKTQVPHRVFLKMNSGMNRLGFAPQRFRTAWTRLNALPQVDEISLMTHFSDADGPRGIAHQVARLPPPRATCPASAALCNSAATLRHAQAAERAGRLGAPRHCHLRQCARPPRAQRRALGLQPAMTLSSKLIGVQQLQPGDTVGYGSSFTADAPMRIGIVACGYADGYPRHCTTGTPVLVNGVRTRLVGRVSMDMLTVDLTAGARRGLRQRGHAVGPLQRRRAAH
jgi:alanine racemase